MAQKWSTRAAGNTVTAIPAGAKIPLLTGVPDNEWITAEDAAADSVFSALYQASDATLTSLSALGTAADRFAYTTGVDVWAEATVTAFARTMLDDANAAAVRGTIGLSASDSVVFDGLAVTSGLNADLDLNAYSLTEVGDITFKTGAAGGTLRTGTSAADKFILEAYKTGAGAGYLNVLRLDAGDPIIVTFNPDSSGNVDIRFNGQNVANLLKITAATDTVSLAGALTSTAAGTFAGLTVNGNITITGTVDGVDVAVLRSDHDTHVANASNPHSVTPAQLGLVIGMNVQAYSANLDAVAASPLTAITAASTYETIANVAAHTGNTGNPHGVTASQVGLGSVENTALSTWAGSANITALGTITTGSIPWARLTDVATQSPTFAGLTVTGMLAPSTVTVALDSGNSQTWVTAIENYGGDCTIIVSGLVTGSAASCGILVQEGTTGLSSDILTHDGVELQFRIITDDLQVASISPGLEGASVKVTALKLG